MSERTYYPESVYPRVEYALRMKGIRACQFANAIDASYSTVHNKLSGITPFTLDEATKVRALLQTKCDLEKLFATKDQINAEQQVQRRAATQLAADQRTTPVSDDFAMVINAATEAERAMIVACLEVIRAGQLTVKTPVKHGA